MLRINKTDIYIFNKFTNKNKSNTMTQKIWFNMLYTKQFIELTKTQTSNSTIQQVKKQEC